MSKVGINERVAGVGIARERIYFRLQAEGDVRKPAHGARKEDRVKKKDTGEGTARL